MTSLSIPAANSWLSASAIALEQEHIHLFEQVIADIPRRRLTNRTRAPALEEFEQSLAQTKAQMAKLTPEIASPLFELTLNVKNTALQVFNAIKSIDRPSEYASRAFSKLKRIANFSFFDSSDTFNPIRILSHFRGSLSLWAKYNTQQPPEISLKAFDDQIYSNTLVIRQLEEWKIALNGPPPLISTDSATPVPSVNHSRTRTPSPSPSNQASLDLPTEITPEQEHIDLFEQAIADTPHIMLTNRKKASALEAFEQSLAQTKAQIEKLTPEIASPLFELTLQVKNTALQVFNEVKSINSPSAFLKLKRISDFSFFDSSDTFKPSLLRGFRVSLASWAKHNAQQPPEISLKEFDDQIYNNTMVIRQLEEWKIALNGPPPLISTYSTLPIPPINRFKTRTTLPSPSKQAPFDLPDLAPLNLPTQTPLSSLPTFMLLPWPQQPPTNTEPPTKQPRA